MPALPAGSAGIGRPITQPIKRQRLLEGLINEYERAAPLNRNERKRTLRLDRAAACYPSVSG
ncbi:hypothetical protein [Kutzneria sp. CA-103260]|uniref:hypothetical protein n=1 Tax=Kutzneria sp. CA-103260 TaxID=2802641 RepID=UPI001BAA7FE7|nr:hypothetical protein [Kutzneria sp. CA-103260]QUQ68793.1 hypothetical protein JJ691_65400 [Kutzneria sp. CA-103260]